MKTEILEKNKESWNLSAERFFGRNPLPEYGPLAPVEDELNLLGDPAGKKVLDIGCGSGHSLLYMDGRGAAELWGIDLSPKQIHTAQQVLGGAAAPVRLFESPMENDPGLPDQYFDIVYSIYALGWTTSLEETLGNIHRFLKPGGTFIFSWEHPFFSRIRSKDSSIIIDKPYHEEGIYNHEGWNTPAFMQQYKVSTYINALVSQGFIIERVIEEACLSEEDRKRHSNRWYSYEKAQYLPTTIIIKSTKAI
ncbi:MULTISPECIES: class I SAM-dependent methyltransferase [Bacillus]|uniref:class I SAM-dependent methyltransferase n=1 Tax=Bacillus TaxID=1386 RepID=UPI00101E1948|nr:MULTISPECIES: class I SAM-dependent methyltransferase [Bacillus]MDT0162497.1 methyltransferase domain-containing protein [Bacillus sp. AG4(2022)]RYI29464.1 class I SAM-dependent methyltransferase [Bacillus infantis]